VLDNNDPIDPLPLEPAPPVVTQPPHLLTGATAHPLAAGTTIAPGLEISRAGEQWQVAGKGSLNGQGIEGKQPLAAGDRVNAADGSEFQLIEVVP